MARRWRLFFSVPDQWIPIVWGAAWALNAMSQRESFDPPLLAKVCFWLSLAVFLCGIGLAVVAIGRNSAHLDEITTQREDDGRRRCAAGKIRRAPENIRESFSGVPDEAARVKAVFASVRSAGKVLDSLLGKARTQACFWSPTKDDDPRVGVWDGTGGVTYAEKVMRILYAIERDVRDGVIVLDRDGSGKQS